MLEQKFSENDDILLHLQGYGAAQYGGAPAQPNQFNQFGAPQAQPQQGGYQFQAQY